MTNLSWHRWIGLGLGCGLSLVGGAAEWPPFDEVYRLVRSNLVGVSETELERAAVEGFLKQLRPRVFLATDGESSPQGTSPADALGGTRLFDRNLAYLRFRAVEAGVAEAFTTALSGLTNRSQIEGLVLDLRFAEGSDYSQAGRVADGFVATARPLLKWGDETLVATSKTNAFHRPVTVLINGETKGAAEALAAVLRDAEVALLLGSPTAGQASLFKEFPLKGGQRLRIASIPVRVGEGQEIPLTGVKPDIAVAVRIEEERLFLDDPYRTPTRPGPNARRGNTNVVAGGTNRPTRINEADLVRMRREGQNLDEEAPLPPQRAAVPEVPVVTDPVLARALDLRRPRARDESPWHWARNGRMGVAHEDRT
jgi:hypothetical protein